MSLLSGCITIKIGTYPEPKEAPLERDPFYLLPLPPFTDDTAPVTPSDSPLIPPSSNMETGL